MSSNSTNTRKANKPNLLQRILNTPIRPKLLIYIELIYVVVMRFATTALGLPGVLSFVLDGLNMLGVLFSLRGFRNLHNNGFSKVLAAFVFFCCVLVVSDVMNGVRPTLVIWAIRNTFRLFGFFLACAVLLDRIDIDRLFSLLFWIQVLNCLVSIVQYGGMGLRQDDLGGIFGVGQGCNAYSNVFFAMLLVYYGLKWLDGDEGCTGRFLFVAISTLVLSALAEMKVYFIEFAVLIIIMACLRFIRVRALVVVISGVIALAFGLQVFKAVFPDSYRDLMNIEEVVSYSTEGMAGYELSRFGSFGQINHLIFNGDLLDNLMGLGFGSAEESNIDMFTSDFSRVWGWLNYRWFTHQMMFIETGYLGFGSFLLIFIAYGVWLANRSKALPGNKTLMQFSIIMVAFTIFNFWYNCASRIEVSYFIALALAVGFIAQKGRIDQSIGLGRDIDED